MCPDLGGLRSAPRMVVASEEEVPPGGGAGALCLPLWNEQAVRTCGCSSRASRSGVAGGLQGAERTTHSPQLPPCPLPQADRDSLFWGL